MLLLAVLAPFLVAAFVPLLCPPLGKRIGYLVAVVPASLLVYFASFVPVHDNDVAAAFLWAWLPELGVNLSLIVNGFNLLFALLVVGIGLLVVLYATAYLGRREDLGKFYLYLLLFMGAMLGVALSGSLTSLYVFWELTSVSSFLLIGFWYTRSESSYGALKSLLITVTGGLAMLAGFILVSLAAVGPGGGVPTFDLAALVERRDLILQSPLAPWALVLILAGAFTKSAQVPFHIWLPDAMAAPTPVSAYLHSATMVKAGLILVAKVWAIFATSPLWLPLVGGLGLLTMTVGGYLALTKTDLKAILALSTVSQLGMIMAAFGLGTRAGMVAAVAHILSHAAFKGSLFMVAGIIDHETGTRDIRRLSGLAKRMPITATIGVIGAFAMMGLPLLNGFVSKELFFHAAMESAHHDGQLWLWLLPAVAVFASIFTTMYCLVLTVRVFFGPLSADLDHHPHDPPTLLWLPPALLAAWVVVTGVVPSLVDHLVAPAAAAVAGEPVELHLALWHGFGPPLAMSLIAVVTGITLFGVPAAYRALAAGLRPPIHANAIYEWLLRMLDVVPKAVTRWHMTGRLRDYLVYIFLGSALALSGAMWWAGGVVLRLPPLGAVDGYQVLLLATMAAGAIMAIFARTRIAALVSLGLVGAGITLYWALMQAPDLALTQLVVEAVSMVLILLVFAHVPQLRPEAAPYRTRLLNGLTAVVTGLMAFGITYLAVDRPPLATIKDFFLTHSLEQAGGRNVVNVILVDFRGFDTMGETTVVAIAVLAVYTLIRLRKRSKVAAPGIPAPQQRAAGGRNAAPEGGQGA